MNLSNMNDMDYEEMLDHLITHGVVFDIDELDDSRTILININDFFAPAADAEEVSYDEIPKLFDLYNQKGYDGVSEFVALKRGIANISWRDKLKDSNK